VGGDVMLSCMDKVELCPYKGLQKKEAAQNLGSFRFIPISQDCLSFLRYFSSDA
jgi:hypothetical protein